jgi:hypothetical protein
MGLLCIIIDFTWIINALQLLSVQVHAAVSISVASDMIPASVATPLSVSNTLAQQQVASTEGAVIALYTLYLPVIQ